MVQANLETHYTKKIKLRYIKFTQGKGGANKCKLRGITQVD